ncbi:MAG: hypothetical protein GXO77_08625 [Calditrichaeota bacterium]|nr:hypothetical protein [Calditrichota bacterium]
MKNVFYSLLVIMLISSCQKDINVYIKKEPGSITGQILPLGINATVELYQGTLIDQVGTDAQGYFYFGEVKPGVYSLRAKAPKYGTQEIFKVQVSDGEGYDIGVIELNKLPLPLVYIYPFDGAKNVKRGYDKKIDIKLKFNRQMDIESVEQAFSINPPIENLNIISYPPSSSNNVSHSFYFKGDFKLETQYTITIDTTAQTISGKALEFTYTGTFETEPFRVTGFLSSSSFDRGNSPVYFYFNSKVNTTTFIENLTIEPPIEITYENVIYERMRISPSLCWIPDTTITFHISKDLQETDGAYLEQDTSFSIITPPLRVIDTKPYNNQHFVPVNQNIEITMNYLVDEGTISDAVSITPTVNFDISTQNSYGRTQIVLSPDSLSPDTKYTVSIDTTLKDYYGGNLKKKYSFNFVTD